MQGNFNDLLRGYTLSMSAFPFFVAFFCAYNSVPDGKAIYLDAFLVALGIVLVHAAVNLFDDYIDVKNKLDSGIKLSDINFKSKRKACAILNGRFSMKFVLFLIISFVLIAFLIGLKFIYLRGLSILFFMVCAFLCGAFYPKSSKYGLSELLIFLAFGPILVCGTYYALTGMYNPIVSNFSVALGLITVVLHTTHSIMEYEYDVESGKKTIPVLLKDKNLAINFISVLILCAYFIILLSIAKYNLSTAFSIPVILTVPMGIKLVSSLYDYIQIKDVKFEPKWYYGGMPDWESVKKSGMDFFMYRFYLARNLAVFFGFFLAVVALHCFEPQHDYIWNLWRML